MNNPTHISQPFVFAVISGKGGVGKSMASINTASMLNKMGYKVAIIDADLGLANCATLFNEAVHNTVSRWINGDCILEDLPQDCSGITLVTGANSPEENKFDTSIFMDALDQVAEYLKQDHDFIIIDTPAGIGEMGLWALDAAGASILVLVDEPAAISDVYRLCKYVFNIDPEYRFASIVNFAESEETAESTFKRFNTILNYFLKKQTAYFGFIPSSESVRKAVAKQHTLLQANPGHEILTEFEFISQNIIAYANNQEELVTKTVH